MNQQEQEQREQKAINFNNNGVTFFEQGRYEDALVLFLGSMEVMSSSSLSSNSVNNVVGEVNKPSFEKQASRTLKKQLRPLINKMEVSTTTTTTTTTTTRTEDKTTTNEYVYSKAIRLPYNNTTTTVVNNTNNDLQKLQAIVINNKVNGAIILYNTALCHHLWNYDDDGSGSGNESSNSKTRAIKLYEMACHVIATIDTGVITCRLLLAIVTNMIHLYNELGMTSMSNTYRIHLYDIVNLQYYWNLQTTTTLTINNMMNTSDNGEEVSTATATTSEIDELISNATFLLNYSPQYHGASAA